MLALVSLNGVAGHGRGRTRRSCASERSEHRAFLEVWRSQWVVAELKCFPEAAIVAMLRFFPQLNSFASSSQPGTVACGIRDMPIFIFKS